MGLWAEPGTAPAPDALDLQVQSAVVSYDVRGQRRVGYVLERRLAMRHIKATWVVKRFRDWAALRERLVTAHPAVRGLPFPEKRGALSLREATNTSKRCIDHRRAVLHFFVRSLCELQDAEVNALLLDFLAADPRAKKRDPLCISACFEDYPTQYDPKVLFPAPASPRMPNLHLKLPCGMTHPVGCVRVNGRGEAKATSELRTFCAVYNQIASGGDRLPCILSIA